MRTFSTPARQKLACASRNELYIQFESYVRQREQNLLHGSTRRLSQFEAISRLKNVLDFHRFSGLEMQCKMVIKYESDLRLLIPSEHSRYYKGAVDKVNHLVQFAHQYLNTNV